jgi:hypothetical protein
MVTASTTASVQDRGPPQSRDSGPIRRSFWHRVIDAVFGYDFFVSYCWADGSSYAQKLAHRLAGEGFVVFFDRNDFVSGDHWQQIGDWTLRRTGKLVLVGTRQALTSVPVQREVRVFHDTGRRILPIDIDGTFESADAQSPLLRYISPEILSIKEPAEALGRRQPPLPGAVELTETAVPVAIGARGAVLLPEQLQRHALSAQLAMNRPPVGLRPSRLDLGQRRRGRKQPYLQRLIGHVLGQRPAHLGRPRPLQEIDDRRCPDRQAQRDIAARHAGRPQPQHVAYLAHG